MLLEQAWGLPWNAGRWNGSGVLPTGYGIVFSARSSQGYTAWYGVAWGQLNVDSTASAGRAWDGTYCLEVNGLQEILPPALRQLPYTLSGSASYYMFTTAFTYGISCFLNLGLSYDFAGGIWLIATTTQLHLIWRY